MRPISPKSLSLVAAVAAALALGACGNKSNSIHGGETEGIYLNVGKLKYQVEISRQLNPISIPEDKTFVQDISPADATLAPDELWFAVFVRVENPTSQAVTPATYFTITDTEGNVYEPVHIGSDNPFYFNESAIPPKGVAPAPNAVAGQLGSINGMELLFKLKRGTLDNRPLVLTIKSFVPPDSATDSLDV